MILNDDLNYRIKVENLFAKYKSVFVLNDISFKVAQGDLICLCGPNGCGKSTLLSVLGAVNDNDLECQNFPTLEVFEKSGDVEKLKEKIFIKDLKRKECAKIISYMGQNENSIWNFSVYDVILSGRFAYSKNGSYSKEDFLIVDEIIEELNLGDFKNRNVHNLSGGEFQKVRISRSLAQTPKFMLLDEPAASLDFVFEPKLMELLKNIAKSKNIGIVLSIHNVNQIENYANKVLMLPKGKANVFGNVEHVLNSENLKNTFGVDFVCKEIKSFQLSQ